jgi:hypothetical protein
VNIRSDKDMEAFLRLSGVSPRRRGWYRNGRNSVRRLRQQLADEECVITVTRKLRKACLIITCDVPKPKPKKGKKRGKSQTMVFFERKFAPDGTEITGDEASLPREKLKGKEKARDGCARLLAEEFGIPDREAHEFELVGKTRSKKPSTESFPGLPCDSTTYIYRWKMPRALFQKEFVEEKKDGSRNVFTAHLASTKLLAQLKSL